MKYYIVALWTSLGPKVLGLPGGYDTEDEAIASANVLRQAGVKHTNGQLAIIKML